MGTCATWSSRRIRYRRFHASTPSSTWVWAVTAIPSTRKAASRPCASWAAPWRPEDSCISARRSARSGSRSTANASLTRAPSSRPCRRCASCPLMPSMIRIGSWPTPTLRRSRMRGTRAGSSNSPRTDAVTKVQGGTLPALLDRRRVLKGLAGVALGAAPGAGAHGFFYERHHLELTRATFPVSGLPEALRGLRIGVLTDIHRSQMVSHEMVATAVRMLMAEKPDLIVLGGDYVSWRDQRYVDPAADALAPLSAPHGVIA